MSASLDWSDSRKLSRFTTGGGPAAVAVPVGDLRHVLENLHVMTVAELAAVEDAGDDVDSTCAFDEDTFMRDARNSALRQRLSEIDAALARITDGTYGVCHACGRRVPFARLESHPETRFCLSCNPRQTSNSLSTAAMRSQRLPRQVEVNSNTAPSQLSGRRREGR